MIDGCSAWNAHVFSAHDEKSEAWTVGIKPVAKKRRREGGKHDFIQCLLCDGSFPLDGLKIHFTRTHLPVLASGFASCVDCDERHQGEERRTSPITGIDAWNQHVQSAHCGLSWYFTVRKSGFAVAEQSYGTQTNVAPGKRRKTEKTGIDSVTPGVCSLRSVSVLHTDDVPRDEFSDDIRTPPSCQQLGIDLSITDPILLDQNDMIILRHGSTTPESLDEPHTPAPWEGTDIRLIDPLLLDEEDRERMKAGRIA